MEQRLSTQRLIVGGLFVTVGVLMLASRLDFLDIELQLWNLWTLVFPAFMVINLVRRDWSGAVTFAFLTAVFVVPRFHPDISVGDVLEQWPIFLVALGISIVVRSFLPTSGRRQKANTSKGSAYFGNRVVRPAGVFRGSEATALIGGLTLDLSEAQLDPDGAMVEVFAFWGGIEIHVPPGMAVDNRVFALMGGAEDSSQVPRPVTPGTPRLEVRGFVWMAGLEIKNP
ncbi:MAG: LiaF domain-containing protein [Acidobacteriota bacterium]